MAQLTFRKQKRRVNYEVIRKGLIWAGEIAAVCLLAFLLVWYFGMRVGMVGDSMKPVLDNGDVTLVNRLVYDMSVPGRGDVIAFKLDENGESHHYIKRVIGLPGETVEIKEGKIFVNGKQIKEKYETTEIKDLGRLEEKIVLGEQEFFVLGDDRQNSEDSRHVTVGNVHRKDIEGKVWFVVSGKNFGFVR